LATAPDGWPSYKRAHRALRAPEPIQRTAPLVALEVLDFPFVLFGGFARRKRSQILVFLRLRVCLPRVQSVFTGLQFSIHFACLLRSPYFRPAVALDLDQSHPGRGLQALARGPARCRVRWGPDPEV